MTNAGLNLAAVDLGASSGRVMAASVAGGRLDLREVHRFGNSAVRAGGTLHWDILGLYSQMLEGLRLAGGRVSLDGVGIDSWAVDYGLLDESGGLLGNPVHYRDARTEGVMERLVKDIPEAELYALTGLQQLPFNTIYQLVSALSTPQLKAAKHLLLIPDLLGYWLTGQVGAEATNASTTQLYDVRSRTWSEQLCRRAGIPSTLLPRLREAGDVIGTLLPDVAAEIRVPPSLPVIAVGSHDTASSVVAVPAEPDSSFAYISSGTWSLIGLELDEPVLTEAAREANFTNEGGVDGRIRFLRNVMGLWLVQESLRTFTATGATADLPHLLDEAAALPAFAALVDPDDPSFLPPGDIPGRISAWCRNNGQNPPSGSAETVRCILESLALAYRRCVREAERLTNTTVEVVHVVGGGARNELLCQLTADACNVPVLAGPVEASALGNVLVQARTLGAELPDLEAMRALIRATHRLRRYDPSGNGPGWAAAERRVFADAP
jgi:rhamnulokinase